MKKIILISSALFLFGCNFSGKRDVKCNVNILGNTVEWSSKAQGEYPSDKAKLEKLKCPTQ